jgi:hypothetical protein
MSRFRPLCCGPAWCLLLAPALAFGQGVNIDHQGVGCVVVGRFPRFDARLDPAGSVARARLHFRPEGGPHWYFVDMKPEAGLFRGILPKPQKTLHRFSYYIDVTDKGFNESRTAEFALDVASGPAACGRQKVLAGSLAKAKVLIHAPEGVTGAPAVPAGFASEGVVTVTSAGVETAATSGAGGGLGPTALIVGGVAVAGGAAAVIATSKGGGGSSTQGPPATTPPAGPPTTMPPSPPPPAAGLGGTWTGNRPGDGMVLTFSGCDECPSTPSTSGADMVLNLSQSGSALSGTLFITTQEDSPGSCATGSCAGHPIGEVIPFSVTGAVSGTSVMMQMTGGQSGGTLTMNGTVTDNRMIGSVTGTDEDGILLTGTWAVNLQ